MVVKEGITKIELLMWRRALEICRALQAMLRLLNIEFRMQCRICNASLPLDELAIERHMNNHKE